MEHRDPAWRRIGFGLLTLVALASAVASVAIWTTGGLAVRIAGTRVRASDPGRALLLAAIAGALAAWCYGPSAAVTRVRAFAVRLTASRIAMVLALATTLTSLLYGSWTASGADAYAYLSQAALWRSGALSAPVPLAHDAPWPDATTSFAPFGYRAAADGSSALVPITAPGIPLLMALLQTIGGHSAAFLVTPFAGGALILLTFGIGRRLDDAWAGVSGAWSVMTSPALVFMLMWPMTDVPAAACTALILWCALGVSTRSAVGAGTAAAFGILIRPTFIAIAVSVGVWFVIDAIITRTRRAGNRVLAYAAGALPGVVVMAWLNNHWYGSPFAVGYGAAGDLLSWAHATANGSRFVSWLAASSPLALLGLMTLTWPWAPVWVTPETRRAARAFALVTGAAWLPYLLYGNFQDWWYLRFLLPAWPAMFLGATLVLGTVAKRGRLAAAGVVIIVIAVGAAGLWTARARGVFDFGERRYAIVARLVASATPPDAVILTNHHAGTVQYYGGRVALRWDVLDAAWLDRAVAWLQAHGRHAYILVEDWEQPIFEARFSGTNVLGRLGFSPTLAWQSARGDGWIWLYDPERRDAPTIHPGPDVERQTPFSPPPALSIWPR